MALVAVVLGALGPILLWPLTRWMRYETGMVVWFVGSMLYDAGSRR